MATGGGGGGGGGGAWLAVAAAGTKVHGRAQSPGQFWKAASGTSDPRRQS